MSRLITPFVLLAAMSCSPVVEVEGDATGECADGVDNDQDGGTDCDDPGCTMSTECAGGNTLPTGVGNGTATPSPTNPTQSNPTGTNPTGTNPTEPTGTTSPYVGGWPFNPDKDGVGTPNTDSGHTGNRFDRFVLMDQYGEMVDLYDFANDDGIPIVIDLSAQWCGPCQEIASWLDGDNPYYDAVWPGVRQDVDNGGIRWITIVAEDYAGRASTLQTVEEWHDDFPHPLIPALADDNYAVTDYIDLGFWPTLLLLEDDMIIEMHSNDFGTFGPILDELARRSN